MVGCPVLMRMGVFSDMMMIMMTYSPWRPGSCNEPGAGSGGAIVPSTAHLHCCAHCLPTSGVGVLGRGQALLQRAVQAGKQFGCTVISRSAGI